MDFQKLRCETIEEILGSTATPTPMADKSMADEFKAEESKADENNSMAHGIHKLRNIEISEKKKRV